MRSGVSLFLLILLAAAPLLAQRPAYPQDYFRNPLDIPMLLAGNFGECRPGHFHSGLDIKTEGRENLVVRAAADGYVSRIKTEPGGFGHALYITHPNGYTTLYAHLNDFAPRLQQLLRQRQYAAESWTQDLVLPPGQFPVKKGEQIAWSGNTGGSTAPHLHFEIRDTKTEHPLNGQLFGFAIRDTKAPVPKVLAIYPRADRFYAAAPAMYRLQERDGSFTTDSVLWQPGLGIGLAVDDYMDGSTNTLAFYEAELYLNDSLVEKVVLDDIGYEDTRYVNAYADYRMKERGAPWIQLLFRLPGNRLTTIYSAPAYAGGPVPPSLSLKVILRDAAGNETLVRARADQRSAAAARPDAHGGGPLLPDSKPASYAGLAVRYELGADCLYAPVEQRLRSTADPKSLSARHLVNDADIPVHSYFPLAIHPDKPVPFALRDKVVLVCKDRDGETGRPATAEAGGWYGAKVRSFGEFRLVADSTAPAVTAAAPAAQWGTSKRISFTARDAATSVKSFRGELDGRWILFEQHGSTWFYDLDAHCPPGAHTLTITARDESGNATVRRYSFVR